MIMTINQQRCVHYSSKLRTGINFQATSNILQIMWFLKLVLLKLELVTKHGLLFSSCSHFHIFFCYALAQPSKARSITSVWSKKLQKAIHRQKTKSKNIQYPL